MEEFSEISSDESYGSDGENEDGNRSIISTMSQTLKTEFSVILLGASKVGKSALASRFMDKEVYLAKHIETVIDSYRQMMFMFNSRGIKDR